MVAVSPDNRLVISASNDETARFWDLGDGREVGRELRHRGEVFVAGFSPNGKLAVTGGYDATLRLWDVPTGQPVGEAMQHEGIVTSAKFSADSKRLVTGSADRSARLWDVTTCLPLAPPLLHNDAVLSVALQRDGRIAFTGRVWRLPGVLADDPPLIDLWLRLATGRQFATGDDIEWLGPAALDVAASEFQTRTSKSWNEWPD
jgi:WD40 repeat protein